MDAKTRRGCLWAALGVGVLVLMLGAALVGGTAWIVYQSSSIRSEQTTPERASDELRAVRDRFAGHSPLIVIDEHERASTCGGREDRTRAQCRCMWSPSIPPTSTSSG